MGVLAVVVLLWAGASRICVIAFAPDCTREMLGANDRASRGTAAGTSCPGLCQETDLLPEEEFPQPVPLYDNRGAFPMPVATMGQMPLIPYTAPSLVGELSVHLEQLHYCHIGGPFVCGGKLVIDGPAGPCQVVVKWLGTRWAGIHIEDGTRDRLRENLSLPEACPAVAAPQLEPARIHGLLAQLNGQEHAEAGSQLNLAVFQLVQQAFAKDRVEHASASSPRLP